jgi:hypothetical protein
MSLALMPQELFEAPTRENAGWGNHGKVYELLEGFDEHGVSRFECAIPWSDAQFIGIVRDGTSRLS